MKAVPTKNAWTPAVRSRRTSSDVWMPLSATTVTPLGTASHGVDEIDRRVQTGLKGRQVAVVDAEQLRFKRERALEFAPVVDFHQHIQTQLAGQLREVRQLRRIQGGDDEQQAVRCQGARLVDLIGIDDEVFAQRRQAAGGAGAA